MNALTSNENLSDSRIDQSQQSRVTFCCSRDSVNAIKITSNLQQREFRCVCTDRHSSRLHYSLCCIVIYLSPLPPFPHPSVIFQNTFECPPTASNVQKWALSTVRTLKSLSQITAMNQNKFRRCGREIWSAMKLHFWTWCLWIRASLYIIHKENPKRCNSVTKFYFIFIWSSTCFEWHTAHHQEPKTALAASGFVYVEGCWTCSCWTLSASSNYTSNIYIYIYSYIYIHIYIYSYIYIFVYIYVWRARVVFNWIITGLQTAKNRLSLK